MLFRGDLFTAFLLSLPLLLVFFVGFWVGFLETCSFYGTFCGVTFNLLIWTFLRRLLFTLLLVSLPLLSSHLIFMFLRGLVFIGLLFLWRFFWQFFRYHRLWCTPINIVISLSLLVWLFFSRGLRPYVLVYLILIIRFIGNVVIAVYFAGKYFVSMLFSLARTTIGFISRCSCLISILSTFFRIRSYFGTVECKRQVTTQSAYFLSL